MANSAKFWFTLPNLETKIGDLRSDVTSPKSSMEFIINTTVEELKSNIENKVDKQVFEV